VDDVPELPVDMTFVDDVPILAAYCVERSYGVATALKNKEIDGFMAQWTLRVLDVMGLDTVVVMVDPVTAMLGLRDRMMHQVDRQRPLTRETSRRSKEGLGGVSRFHRLLQEQMRALRLELQSHGSRCLSSSHPLTTWLVRHAMRTLARFQPGKETGLMPYARVWGRPCAGRQVGFGEKVCALAP
jgi:hypothetical protein